MTKHLRSSGPVVVQMPKQSYGVAMIHVALMNINALHRYQLRYASVGYQALTLPVAFPYVAPHIVAARIRCGMHCCLVLWPTWSLEVACLMESRRHHRQSFLTFL